ncbi:MAG: FG-GAP repeat protein [Candidatus Eisenbacteria bacterium]|uniref:FG-GAP repeat protein n=1 Tax=Eiseniibacteriota bacterium TaxID=2212470 RepID=A0A956NGL8_UNCEI|nr:FG-GAP repeat protein [Candidatus Eisenbacteria bacterium]
MSLRSLAAPSVAGALILALAVAGGAAGTMLTVDDREWTWFGHYTLVAGEPHAVEGETWTFDHGSPDPLEGWEVRVPGSENYWSFPTLAEFDQRNPSLPSTPGLTGLGYGGQQVLWLGVHEDTADALCWPGGMGIGNDFAGQRATSPIIVRNTSLPGNTMLRLPVIWERVPFGSDSLKVLVETGGTEQVAWVAPSPLELSGEHTEWLNLDPFLGSNSSFRIAFEWISYSANDEDGGYDRSFGACRFDNIALTGDGLHEFFSFDGGPRDHAADAADGGQTSAQLGGSMAAADVNGDGIDDLVVGSPYYTNGQSQEGAVFVYLMESDGSLTFHRFLEANFAGAYFGFSVAGADVDGDGYDDVVVGAPTASVAGVSDGAVFVYHGGPTGLDPSPALLLESGQDYSNFGQSVANAGDVDGDGFEDVLIGQPLWYGTLPAVGRVLLHFGSSAGLSSTPGWTLEGQSELSYLGLSLAGNLDFTGDGKADFVVGAPFESNGTNNLGRVYAFTGHVGGVVPYGDLWGFDPVGGFGYSLALSPNQGQVASIVIGNPYEGPANARGAVYSIGPYGSYRVGADEDLNTSGGLGIGLAGADVNGDGYGDIIAGSPEDDDGHGGRAIVLTSGPFGLTYGRHPTWVGGHFANPGDIRFGQTVCVLDVDSALPTVAVGMPKYASLAGRVETYRCEFPSNEGWTFSNRALPSFVGLAPTSDYSLPGGCVLSDNVLELHDDAGRHPTGQRVQLLSPIIDLPEPGTPDGIVAVNSYLDLPYADGIFYRWWMAGRTTCPSSGAEYWETYPLGGSSNSYFYNPEPECKPLDWPHETNYFPLGSCTDVVDAVRVCYEIYSSCDAFGIPPADCTGDSNVSPLLDDIQVGISGNDRRILDLRAFDDANGDGIRTFPETWVTDVRFDVEGLVGYSTTDDWIRFLGLEPGLHTVSIVPRPGWRVTAPPSGQLIVDLTGPCSNVFEIGVQPDGGPDLAVVVWTSSKWKPGYFSGAGVDVRNWGSVAEAAIVRIQVPSEVIVQSTNPPATPLGNGLFEWQVPSVAPGGEVFLDLFAALDSGVPPGTILDFAATVELVSGVDVNPADNAATTSALVVSALDPNGKSVTPEGAITEADRLTYQVDFQNVGTAAATFVIVEDDLDPDLDVSTLLLEATSHPAEISVAGRRITWRFDDIDLVPQSEDEAASHGLVRFSILPKSGSAPGTEITNSALITFDYADPIETNLVTNWIADAAEVPVEPAPVLSFHVGMPEPNPVVDGMQLAVSLPNPGDLSFQVIDTAGRRVFGRSSQLPAGSHRIAWNGKTESGLPIAQGVYFVDVKFADSEGDVKRERRRMVLVR